MCAGVTWRVIINHKNTLQQEIIDQQYDKYGKFVDEVYKKVQENYWEKISNEELSNLFLLATNKATNQQWQIKSQDREGVVELWHRVMETTTDDKKTETPAMMVDLVLANLKPFGRSRLYSQTETKSLSDTVNNIDETNNRFEQLGIGNSSNDEEVNLAYEKKVKEATNSAEKETVEKAYEVLKDSNSRQRYATSGIEPTVEYKLIDPQIFYIRIKKFSPTTIDEFV